MGFLRPWLVRSFRTRERGEESRFLHGFRQCALQLCQPNCYQWDARILSNFCGLREMSAPTRQAAITGSAVPRKAIGGPTAAPPSGTNAQVPAKWGVLRILAQSRFREMASLITASWNQLAEWLKRVETLREWVQGGSECGLRS